MVWDVRSFGNDQANDWLKGLVGSISTDPIKKALLAVLRTDTFIDAQDAERAIAAAEIVAASRGKSSEDIPMEASMWLRAQKFVAQKEMLELSILVVSKIAKKSELRELWDGTDVASDWRKAVFELRERLISCRTHEAGEAPPPELAAELDQQRDMQVLDDVNGVFNQAVELVGQGRHEDAIFKYKQLIGLDPHFVVAYIGRGTSYLAMGQFEYALEDFNTAIDLEPEVGEAYYLRAQVQFQLGNFGKAVADLTILLGISPGRSDAFMMRGLANMALSRFDKAVIDFTKTLDINSDSATAYLHRSKAYEKQGRFDLAGKDKKQYERLMNESRAF